MTAQLWNVALARTVRKEHQASSETTEPLADTLFSRNPKMPLQIRCMILGIVWKRDICCAPMAREKPDANRQTLYPEDGGKKTSRECKDPSSKYNHKYTNK